MAQNTHTEIKHHNPHVRHLLIIVYLLTNAVYLGWRFLYTLPIGYGWISMSFGLILVFAELSGFLENVIFYITLWDVHKERVPDIPKGAEWPSVDVYVATYNEPMDLLEKTLNGCTHMEYPDKTKVRIYLCDDGHREEAKTLANRMGVHYLTRDNNVHAKAGNLNHALTQSSGDLVVTFDADMIPQRSFLMRTVPFFMVDKSMGFVQTPQSFYNPDTFQYNLFVETQTPNEQDLFFTLVQNGRSRFNATIYAGSNTVLSRKALAETGNFTVDTITEDFATGMKLQAAGYRSIYLNEILASGLTPSSIVDLYNQRIRWANGVVESIKIDNPLFKKGFSLMQRLLYLSTISYWFFGLRRIIYIAAPLVFILLNITILKASLMEVLMFWAPMYVMNHFTFRYFSEGIRSATWSNIYETILAPSIALNVVKQFFGIRVKKFVVTPKETIERRGFVRRFDLIRPQWVLALLSLLASIKLVFTFVQTQDLSLYTINIFWLLFNGFLLVMTILFATERPIVRSSERFNLNLPIQFTYGHLNIKTETCDVSEGGFSLALRIPMYFEPKSIIDVTLTSDPYQVKFKARLVRTFANDDQQVYAFECLKMDDASRLSYLQVLYDRIPPMQRMHEVSSLWRMMMAILSGRRFKPVINRQYPRLMIQKTIPFYVEDQMIPLWIEEFNYRYMSIYADEAPLHIRLWLGDQKQATFSLDQSLSTLRQKENPLMQIYRIDAIDDQLALDLFNHFENAGQTQVQTDWVPQENES